jgi:Terminase large subunit, T4likevirus-type, N-terminal
MAAPLATIRPQRGLQETFLSTSADIAIAGGSAGSGKTWSLLLEPVRHVTNPGFGGVIFRRESPQITNQGGLWDESQQLYACLGAVPMRSSLAWRFPSGAKLTFAHMEYDKDRLA